MKKELIDNTWARYQCDNCCTSHETKPCVMFLPNAEMTNPWRCPISSYYDEGTNWQKVD